MPQSPALVNQTLAGRAAGADRPVRKHKLSDALFWHDGMRQTDSPAASAWFGREARSGRQHTALAAMNQEVPNSRSVQKLSHFPDGKPLAETVQIELHASSEQTH